MKINVGWMLSVLMLCVTAQVTQAGELLLGGMERTSYQVVVPDEFDDPALEQSVTRAAELMQQAFAAQDIEIAVVSESEADADRPSIHVGNTRFAADNGVTFERGQGWTYTWKAVGKHLIVAGNDQPDPIPMEKRRSREARHGGIPMHGTLKSVCEFVYEHLGARFLTPGEDGLTFLPTPVIFVPDDLDVTRRTYARNLEISKSSGIYAIANGMEPHTSAMTNYGHYHHTVINTDSHGESHPEYFIYRSGRRQTDSRHLCFSNPDVREAIYQKMLEDADTGYTLIELGQNDGFIPCGCEECYELYDIHPTHTSEEGRSYLMDAAWGEKLWIMHRDLALRLQKDRPDVKVMISAYSVAKNPPKTIDSLPENVIVQMMHPTPERFEAWSRIDVPGGYAAYLYTWGVTKYTPLRSRAEMKELIQTLVENDVRLIQINGKPGHYGIEGINVYAFMRMMNDPDAKSIDALYDEYIEAAYQEAAGPMSSFYRKLHQRLVFRPETVQYSAILNRNPLLLYNTLYTPELMTALESYLSTAEQRAKSEGVKARLAATRMEFDHLKHIADVITHYYAYLTDKNEASHERVLNAVEKRNQWLREWTGEDGRVGSDAPTFTWRTYESLKQNRSLNVEPFNWDIEQRRGSTSFDAQTEAKQLTVQRVDQTVTIDSAAWEDVETHALQPSAKNKEPLQAQTTFQTLYDDRNLYVRVEAELDAADMDFHERGRDPEIWLQECVHLNLAPSGDKSQYYYLNYEPVPNSYTDAQHGFITDPLHPKFGWNDNTWDGDWSYESVLDEENDRWVSMVTVPFETLDTETPTAGTMWMGNVGRVHFYDDKSKRELSVWAEELNVSNIPGDGYFGEWMFE